MEFEYNIIDEVQPYYTRFTHVGIDNVVTFCKNELAKLDLPTDKFIHHVLPIEASEILLEIIPFKNLLTIRKFRMSLFISPPWYRHHVHRDAPQYNYVSINYGIEVADNNCVASWYSDEVCNKYSKQTNNYNKEFFKDVSLDEVPLQQLTTLEEQCVLLNTDIFHDWNNNSPHRRVVLTLRIQENPTHLMTYDVVRKILFNNGTVGQW